MDCGRVDLAVNGRDLPGAAAEPAESPVASTECGISEPTLTGVARTLACFEFDDGVRSIEHAFVI
jgi:hypothetical protein